MDSSKNDEQHNDVPSPTEFNISLQSVSKVQELMMNDIINEMDTIGE